MSNQPITSLLVDDDRAVAPVIGVVILFGFLILSLSLYQVQVVPQQNAQVEFQHFEEVRNDLVELRAGILQAGSTDRPQYQTVWLGTSYSTRLFAINPPAPAGTIRTVESPPITISNGEETVTIPTRFLQYRPGYNEIDQSPTWYDTSVLYVDAREEGGGVAVIEGQELVDNENVSIVALQREFRRSGTGRVTVELQPAVNPTDEIPDGPLTITIPTRLSESDWENKTDLTESPVYDDVTDTDNDVGVDNSDIYNLTLNTNANNLTVDTVGVQEAPEEPTQIGGGESENDDESPPPSNDGDLPGGESVVGSPDIAFDDADDDGVFDEGETTFSKSELDNFDNTSVNLVIPDAVGEIRNDDGISITARSITSEVDFRSNGGTIDLAATEGEILINTEVRSQKDTGAVSISGKRIDVSDADIQSDKGGVTISATQAGGGELIAVGTDLRAQKTNINLNSVGDMFLDDAELISEGIISADLAADYTIHLSGTILKNQKGPGAIQYTPDTVTKEPPDSPLAEPQ